MALDDYGALVRSGMASVPDYAQQQVQRRQQQMQQQQQGLQSQALQLQMQKAQQQLDGERAFRADLDATLLNPTPEGFSRLLMKHPEYADQVKQGWSMMDAPRQQADLRQMTGIYSALRVKRPDLAAAELRRRIEADRAADGQADPQDEAILAALESGDPTQITAAEGLVGGSLAAIAGPDKFASAFKDLHDAPNRRTVVIDGILTDADTGEAIAQSPYQRIIAGPDGSFFQQEPVTGIRTIGGGSAPTGAAAPVQQGGGGQASGGAGSSGGSSSPRSVSGTFDFTAVPGARETSAYRTPEHNRKVGGVANSYHTRRDANGNPMARDFVPPAGMSTAQLAGQFRAKNPHLDVINEGDHVHIEPRGQMAGPIQVRSKQQYDRLPKGAQYVAPDGSMRVKG